MCGSICNNCFSNICQCRKINSSMALSECFIKENNIKTPELVVREKYLYSRNTKQNTDEVTGCQIKVSYPLLEWYLTQLCKTLREVLSIG